MLLESGELDSFDEYSIDKKMISVKNSFLVPIFIEIKKIIKMIKNSEFGQLENDFLITQQGLKRTIKNPEELEKKLLSVREIYRKIIFKLKKDL